MSRRSSCAIRSDRHGSVGRGFRAVGLCSALTLLPALVWASTIQIELASRVVVATASVVVSIDVTNHGTAPARRLETILDFRGAVSTGDVMTSLSPGEHRVVTFELPVPASGARGRWPVVVRARWHDDSGRLFEALHVDTASLGGGVDEAGLRVGLDDVRVETSTTTTARVTGGRAGPAVRLTLVAPVGLRVTAHATSVSGSGETSVPLTIVNVGATIPSRLPIAAIVEGDTSEGHHTAVALAFVDVGPAGSRTRFWIAAVLVAAFVATAVVFVWRRTRRQGSAVTR